jgi:hypothetical protein
MHQELDAYRLSCIRAHVHRLLYPNVIVTALMEDRLQDRAIGIGNISILPVVRDEVEGAGPVPEA